MLKLKNISFLLIIILSFILIMGISSSDNDGSNNRFIDNHALIIGIEKYDEIEWVSSRNSVKDANKIAKILKEIYNFKAENVTLLTDETRDKPNLRTIAEYFERYKNSLTENDNLLIFYSGHNEEDEEGQTYWISRDGIKDSPFTWIKHEDICKLYLEHEDFKAKNVIVLSDSPFSRKKILEKAREKSIQELSNILGVDNVLEGNVRKAGNSLRITAQIFQVSDDLHLWSRTYD